MKTFSYRSRSFLSLLSLTAALAIVSVVDAADVSFYGVIKGQNYIQNNPTTPSLSDDNSGGGKFFFNAWAELTATNSVTNATVQVPISGAVKTLQLNAWGDGQEFRESFEAPLFLDGTYANGDYILLLKTKNDGDKTITLNMSGTYANIPVVNNFNALQAVTPASSYTVSWSISGGLATDYVQLEVSEENSFGASTQIYQSPQPGQPGALNGTATSTNITTGPLSAGKIYKGRIMVARGTFDTTSYGSGVGGVVAYTRRTEFPIIATGTPVETVAPQLNTSTPSNGEGNVATNAVIGFTFNERMKTNVSVASSIQWSGGGINAANFNYAWSPDSKTLYCVYNTSLPSGATIQWTLNPTNTLQNLRDLADNKFSANYQGGFTTASTGSAGVKDVKRTFVFKGQGATQTNATGPVALSLFFAGMGANLSAYNTVTNGSLTVPTATPSVLTPVRNDYPYGNSFDIHAKYDSKANLDLFFPDGNYTVSLGTAHDGNMSFNDKSLTGNSYPNLPNISNFTEAQTVNSTNSFTVNWATFTGGGINDFIQLQIENENGDSIYQTAQPGEAGALIGTATSTTIPAGKLYPGRTYQARLQFIKVMQTDTTAYPGVTFRTAYFSETQFNLVTTGTPILAQLSVLPFNSGQFTLRLTGEPQRTYTIKASDTLTSGSWFQLQSRTADGTGHIDFTDFSYNGLTRRFYRAMEGYGN